MKFIDIPTWLMLIGGALAVVASAIVSWKEKDSYELRILSAVAAIGGLLTIGGGVWSGYEQKADTETAAQQDLVRIDLRLKPSLDEYQRRLQLMHGLYDDNREIQEGFDFAVVAEILHDNILNPDDGYFTRVSFVDLYFDSQEQIHQAIDRSLLKLDRSRFPKLADLLEEQQRSIEATNPQRMRKRITNDAKEKTQIIYNGKLITVVVRSLQIEAHVIKGKDQPSVLKPYIDLYYLINKSIVFQKQYDSVMNAMVEDR